MTQAMDEPKPEIKDLAAGQYRVKHTGYKVWIERQPDGAIIVNVEKLPQSE